MLCDSSKYQLDFDRSSVKNNNNKKKKNLNGGKCGGNGNGNGDTLCDSIKYQRDFDRSIKRRIIGKNETNKNSKNNGTSTHSTVSREDESVDPADAESFVGDDDDDFDDDDLDDLLDDDDLEDEEDDADDADGDGDGDDDALLDSIKYQRDFDRSIKRRLSNGQNGGTTCCLDSVAENGGDVESLDSDDIDFGDDEDDFEEEEDDGDLEDEQQQQGGHHRHQHRGNNNNNNNVLLSKRRNKNKVVRWIGHVVDRLVLRRPKQKQQHRERQQEDVTEQSVSQRWGKKKWTIVKFLEDNTKVLYFTSLHFNTIQYNYFLHFEMMIKGLYICT